MKIQFTPGPWHVSMQGVTADTNERRVLIAFEEGVELSNAVDDKNLIAAAPRMYDALTAIAGMKITEENDNG